MSGAPLEQLDENLWVASRPLPLWVGDIGTRMTVLRLGGALRCARPRRQEEGPHLSPRHR
jgi:hypothetical protein